MTRKKDIEHEEEHCSQCNRFLHVGAGVQLMTEESWKRVCSSCWSSKPEERREGESSVTQMDLGFDYRSLLASNIDRKING